MKDLIVKTATCLVALLITSPSFSQCNRGESVINIGAGFSAFSSPSNTSNSTNSIPVISGTYDYAIVDHFSYGGGVSYQQFSENLSYYNGTAGSQTFYTQNIYVTNIGIRALYHFGSDMLEGYTGVRLGYSIWSSIQPGYVSNGYYVTNYNKSVPSFLALVGMRASISDLIAVHIEVGLGSPYVAETGISFKLGGGMPQSSKPPPPVQPAQQF